MASPLENVSPVGLMKVSLGVGVGMLVMKLYAYFVTGSSAIFSDAAESVVHNLAVAFALYSQWYSNKPSDRSHLYGHEKIGYFSSGFEGTMIILAGLFIIVDAARKWMSGLSIERLDTGLWFTVAATAINSALGLYLIWRGRRSRSVIVEANGHHVLTDGWTSLGVIVGLLLVKFTGWKPFDPLCAMAVATNILFMGGRLLRGSIAGLMDEADAELDRSVRTALDREVARHGVTYHELRHRRAGPVTWIEFHLLFRDETPLREAHRVATAIEEAVGGQLGPELRFTTHLEPREDHVHIHQTDPLGH